jgi:sugar O-acyltransferase (sialic acid O-acetyltransferase NeuD family)
MKIGVLGNGRFAREIGLYARRWGYEVVHFFDGTIAGSKVVDGLPYCIGVGSPQTKRLILEQSQCKNFISVFCPDAIYEPATVEIGKGCVVCPGVVLTHSIVLGNFVTLNQNCTIGHDCRLGNLVNVAPGANISGNVTIGDGCDIGTNSAIREKTIIADDITLGLNAGVVGNLVEHGVYVGTPARRIK